MQQMSKLIIHSNVIESIPFGMSGLTLLTLLDAHKNRLTAVPDFRQMTSLVIIDLRENQLTSLPSLPLSGTVSQLFLGFNRIGNSRSLFLLVKFFIFLIDAFSLADTRIPDGGMTPAWEALKELHLNNNSLLEVPAFVCDLRAIKVIDLSNNEIAEVPYQLGYIESLNRLGLEGNPIKSIRRTLLVQSTDELKKYLRTRGDPPLWLQPAQTLQQSVVDERARDISSGCLDLSQLSLEAFPPEVPPLTQGEEVRINPLD
jgi:Leucine-rich repeat (LRR) protein